MPGDYDEFAVSVVVDERVAMRLRGADKVEAVRRLSAKGVPSQDILDLLKWPVLVVTLSRFRSANGIPQPVYEPDPLSRFALNMEWRRGKLHHGQGDKTP